MSRVPRARKCSRSIPSGEHLEGRQMLTSLVYQPVGVVDTNFVESQEVAPGDTVTMSETDISIRGFAPGTYAQTIEWSALQGTSLEDVDLVFRADLYGKDGDYETIIGMDTDRDDTAELQLGRKYGRLSRFRDLNIRVDGIIDAGATSQAIGLQQADANIVGWQLGRRGRGWRWNYGEIPTRNIGFDNPQHGVIGNEMGSLTVVQKQLTSVDTVVENEKDVTLLAFEATADDVEDLVVTGARFIASMGSASNVSVYHLWADTDGIDGVDTIVDTATAAANGVIDFDDVFAEIPQSESVLFEVHGDMASTFTTDTFQLAFADTNAVEAEAEDDGKNLDTVPVFTVDSTEFICKDQGSVFITQDATPVPSRYRLGGELTGPVFRFSAHAEYEDIDITYVGLNIDGDAQSIDRFELYFEGSVTPFGAMTRAAGKNGDLFGVELFSNEFLVPEGHDTDVVARARIKPDYAGGKSGDQFAVTMGSVEAAGHASSNVLLQNNGDAVDTGEVFIGTETPGPNQSIVGTTQYVSMSRINSVTNASPDLDGFSIPVGISDAGQFRLTAAAHNNFNNGSNDVVLRGVSFHVLAENVAFNQGGFALYNKANSTVVASNPVVTQLGTDLYRVTFENLDQSSVNTEIDKGTSETFVLRMDITNPKVNLAQESRLQVSMDLTTLSWLDEDAGDSTLFTDVLYTENVIHSTLYIS